MIAAANERRSSALETYLAGDMEDLTAIADGSFDLAVSYISLVDVIDYRRAISETFRILRPGGRFICCNLAPMVTAGNMWVRYGDGTKLHFRLDNYLDESTRDVPMCGYVISNTHRTLSSYMNAFLETGFVLDALREPFPSQTQLRVYPANEDLLRVPLFIIYVMHKR